MGVLFAAIVAGAERAGSADSANVLAVIEEQWWAVPLGFALFVGSIARLYARTRSQADLPVTPDAAGGVEAAPR